MEFLTPGAYQVAEMSAQPRRRSRRRSVKPPIRYQQATQTSAVEQRRLRVALANSKVVKVLYDGKGLWPCASMSIMFLTLVALATLVRLGNDRHARHT